MINVGLAAGFAAPSSAFSSSPVAITVILTVSSSEPSLTPNMILLFSPASSSMYDAASLDS